MYNYNNVKYYFTLLSVKKLPFKNCKPTKLLLMKTDINENISNVDWYNIFKSVI